MVRACGLLFLCLTIFHVTFAAPQCSINVKKGMHKTSPPLLISPSNPPTYIYPDVDDPANIVVHKGEELLVVCPGRTNQKSTEILEPGVLLVKSQSIKSNSETVQCVGNDKFKIRGKTVDFTDISCEEKPRASYNAILRSSSKKCDKGHRYEIGYDLGDLGFLKTIELCHDEEKAKTLWSYAKIQPVNQEFSRFSGNSAKNFKAGSLYDGMTMSKKEPYNLQVAYDTLQGIFGGDGDVDDYLSTKTSDRKFLAKGHLIANADKFYKSEQDSTYFYANVVPMWQAINANPGNWFFVEEYVRHLAYHKQRELEVYVGGLATLRLHGKNFTLYRDEKIPVPEILYKCVLDKDVAQGLCFMVVNNPYIGENEVDDYVVCKRNKICDKVTENYKDTTLGYMYCCNIRDFYKAAQGELGLEELKPLRKYKEMELLTKENNPSKIKG